MELASRSGIARRLTAEKVPTPMTMRGDVRAGGEWRVGVISHILHNRLYSGAASWNKRKNVRVKDRRRTEPRPEREHIPVKVPKIIDAGLFAAVQKQLENSAKFSPRHQTREYLLKGLLYCACGRRMYGFPTNDVRYYKCSGRAAKECTNPSRKADSLEMAASLEVVEALIHPDAVLALADEQRFGKKDERLARVDTVNDQLARLPLARSRLIDSYTEGTIDKAEFKAKMAALQGRKQKLEQERDTIQAQLGQEQVDELTASRLAEILSEHKDEIAALGKTLAALEKCGYEVPQGQDGRPYRLFEPLPADILRAVLRRVSVGANGTLTFEAVVPLKAREKSVSAGRSR